MNIGEPRCTAWSKLSIGTGPLHVVRDFARLGIFAMFNLLLVLLAIISGCGGDDPITQEETVRVSSVTVSVDLLFSTSSRDIPSSGTRISECSWH